MPSGNVVSTVEGTGESVLVQHVALATSNRNNAEGLEAREVIQPRAHCLVASPREFLASITMVSRPQRSVPFVEADHSLNTFKRSPSRPRRTRRYFVTQGCSIERVGGARVSEEGARVENVRVTLGPCPHQDVIVQVRFTVTVDAVSEGDDALPLGWVVTVVTVAAIAHHHGPIFQVVNGRAHRRAVGPNDAGALARVDRKKYGDRTRRRDDEVVPHNLRSLARHQHARHVAWIARLTLSA
jgi:hypothetical protein